MKKITEAVCYLAYEPPVPEGMTHARDWEMEGNRPKTKPRDECTGKDPKEGYTGLTFRQPL